MTIYMIRDGNGDALTDGLQDHEAARIAQRMANDRGESVWLSEHSSEDTGEEFRPSTEARNLAKAREALDAWDAEDDDEIAAVFRAIYERDPGDNDDAVSGIYAARGVLTIAEAKRVLAVLG